MENDNTGNTIYAYGPGHHVGRVIVRAGIKQNDEL